MTLRYTIEHWRSPTSERAAFYETCKRKDRAATVLWAAIYNMIEGNGLLDRPIAWQLLRQFDACDISPPERGTYRLERFRLGDETVTFRAEYI